MQQQADFSFDSKSNVPVRYSPSKIDAKDQDYKLIKEYAALLKTQPWRNKRKEILQRDGYQCTHCAKKESLRVGEVIYTGAKLYGYNTFRRPLYRLVIGDKYVSLHVHHRLYVLERLPWEYNQEELVTLCQDCHTKEHQKTIVPVYLTEMKKELNQSADWEVCVRCGGDGHLPEFHYHQNGVCFGCDSLGFVKKNPNNL